MEDWYLVFRWAVLLMALKSITVGSSFNFYKWFTKKDYYKQYSEWLERKP